MLSDPFWLSLLVKMAGTALVVITAALMAERLGPFIGGIIVALPVSAGPAYVLLAFQADDAFLSGSALSSLTVVPATALYLAVYARLARRHGVLACLAGALAAWLAVALLVRPLPWSWPAAAAFNLAAFAACLRLTRRSDGGTRGARADLRWFDLPMRALLVCALVAGVLLAGRALGPTITGMAAVFPVTLSSMALLIHPRLGGPAAGAAMAGTLRAMPGFGLALLMLHLTAVPLGAATGLCAALAMSIGWSIALLLRNALRPESTEVKIAPAAG